MSDIGRLSNALMAKMVMDVMGALPKRTPGPLSELWAESTTTTTETTGTPAEMLTLEKLIAAADLLNPPVYYQTSGFIPAGSYFICTGAYYYPDYVIIANGDADQFLAAVAANRLRAKKLGEYRDGDPYAKLADAAKAMAAGAQLLGGLKPAQPIDTDRTRVL